MNNKEEKEIDLLEILVKFILFIKRRFLLILIILIAGTSLGFFKSYFEKKKYENQIIGNCDFVSNSVIYQIIKTLSQDFQNNSNFFSRELNISKDITNKLIKIEIDTITFAGKSAFEIKIQAKDSNTCEQIKTAIYSYLPQNLFIKEEYNFILNQKKQLIAELTQKIKELDSLQKFIRVASLKDKNQIAIFNSYYSEYISLVEKKQKAEKEFKSLNDFICLYIDKTALMNNNILKKIIIYFIISLMLGFLIALCIEINRKVINYRKQHQN